MNPLGLARSVRSLNRIQQIARVLTQHGFGHIVHRLNLGRYTPFPSIRRKAAEPPGPGAIGQRLAAAFTELGPTFVKFGQVLTTRPDLVPEDVILGLRTLQDRVDPFDTELAMQIITEDLGAPPQQSFRSIEPAPFASGSIGQVYRAVANDGMEVVVKVKRPGVEDTLRLDMHILKWLADAMERHLPEAARYKPVMLVEEFEETITREMDYVNEAASTARFHEAFAADEYVVTPRVRWDLCGNRVLTLEAVSGRNVDTVLQDGAAGINRKLIADRLANLFLKQFFELGIFHADPHPGNILITPPAQIGLIDFGQIGIINDELAYQLVVLIVAGLGKEVDLVVDTLADMRGLGTEVDRAQLARSLRLLLEKYYGLPIGRVDHRRFFSEVSEVFRQNDVTVPRDVVILIKSLATVAGVAMQLDPQIDLAAMLRPRLRQMVGERLAPRRLLRGAGISAWHLLSILRGAPRQLRTIMQRLGMGHWQLTVRHENLERLTSELDRSSNRLAFSIVIAAIIVGSSLILTTSRDRVLLGVSLHVFGILGYLFAGVMGVGLLWAIFRSGRLS